MSLLRIEGDASPVVQTLVQTLEQELCDGTLSAHSQQWLNHAQLNQEQLLALLKPLPERATPLVHLYYCDHLGTPLALINQQGEVDWQAEFDAWGNQVAGRNPLRLYQPIRMQGQHYDEETGLHYNRHRYYDPMLGRYINQDPIGLMGGMNTYQYPLNPIQGMDPLGLYNPEKCASIKSRIENLKKEIWDKRYPDLMNNPGGLPYRALPGSMLRESVQGHEILITIALSNLDNAWKEWRDNGCDDPPPPSPVKCPETETVKSSSSETSSISAGDVATGAAVVGTGALIGYGVYRVVRFLPSLLPPLWWTIPANAAVP